MGLHFVLIKLFTDVHVHTSHANTLPQAYTAPKRNTTKSPDQRPSSPFSHKGGYSMAGGTNEITSYVDAGRVNS